METWDLDFAAMRAWSKAMFRRDHRLAVAVAAIDAPPGELYAQAIAKRLGIPQAEAARHLRDFEELGMLTPSTKKADRAGTDGGRPGIAYDRTKDDFWKCLDELGDRFRRAPPPPTPRRPKRRPEGT